MVVPFGDSARTHQHAFSALVISRKEFQNALFTKGRMRSRRPYALARARGIARHDCAIGRSAVPISWRIAPRYHGAGDAPQYAVTLFTLPAEIVRFCAARAARTATPSPLKAGASYLPGTQATTNASTATATMTTARRIADARAVT